MNEELSQKVLEILKKNLTNEELMEFSELIDGGRIDELVDPMDEYLAKVFPDRFR